MADEKDSTAVPLLRQKCPNCAKRAVLEFRPFCSKRCADVDLGRWLNEDYRIPGEEVISSEEDLYDDES